MARERRVQLRELSLTQLDELWDAAKAEVRAEAANRQTAARQSSAEETAQ
jgi:hypothetical protein